MFSNPKYKRRRVSIHFPGPKEEGYDGMTEQQHKASCDIHVIMQQAAKTGMMKQRPILAPHGVLPEDIDYHTALNYITQAEQLFDSLPSTLRNKFDNDPAKFLEFTGDEANRSQMEEMGISTDHFPPLPSGGTSEGKGKASETPPPPSESPASPTE